MGRLKKSDLNDLLAHSAWVKRLARALVRDQSLADDVAQLAWMEALRHPPTHRKNLKGWLSFVVRNAARKIGRSERSRSRRERWVAKEEAEREEFLALEKDVLRDRIAKSVHELEEPYRTVLLLRFFEELSPEEIAQRLQIPVKTVYTRISRALDRVSAHLTNRYGDPKSWIRVLVPFAGLRPGASSVKWKMFGVAAAGVLVLTIPGWILFRNAPAQETAASPVVSAEPIRFAQDEALVREPQSVTLPEEYVEFPEIEAIPENPPILDETPSSTEASAPDSAPKPAQGPQKGFFVQGSHDKPDTDSSGSKIGTVKKPGKINRSVSPPSKPPKK